MRGEWNLGWFYEATVRIHRRLRYVDRYVEPTHDFGGQAYAGHVGKLHRESYLDVDSVLGNSQGLNTKLRAPFPIVSNNKTDIL